MIRQQNRKFQRQIDAARRDRERRDLEALVQSLESKPATLQGLASWAREGIELLGGEMTTPRGSL